MTTRTTVGIPLFEGAQWLPVIVANIERIRGTARILVSDATERDDALSRLRDRFADADDIEFIGARDLPSGWVAHCNDLLARATTEFFMWLPQDDDIDDVWIPGGEKALDARPDAVLAVGDVERLIKVDGSWQINEDEPTLSLRPVFASTHVLERLAPALASATFTDGSLLGLTFRGLQRVSLAVPVSTVPESGEAVDILWAVRLLTRGAFVRTEGASYSKRFYPESVHAQWRDLRREPDLRVDQIRSALADLDAEMALKALSRAWNDEVDFVHNMVRAEVSRGAEWHDELVAIRTEMLSTDQRAADFLSRAEIAETEVARLHAELAAATARAKEAETRADIAEIRLSEAKKEIAELEDEAR